MLLETLDARIARAHQRLKEARTLGRRDLIADRQRQLDVLLERRLEMTVG